MIKSALDQTWIVEHRSRYLEINLLPGWGHLYRGERRQGLTYLSAGPNKRSAQSSRVACSDSRHNRDEPSTAHRRDDANAHYDRANLLWMGAAIVHLTSIVDTLATARGILFSFDLSRLNWEDGRGSRTERGQIKMRRHLFILTLRAQREPLPRSERLHAYRPDSPLRSDSPLSYALRDARLCAIHARRA